MNKWEISKTVQSAHAAKESRQRYWDCVLLVSFIFSPHIAEGFIAVIVYNRMHELEISKFDDAVKREDAELLK